MGDDNNCGGLRSSPPQNCISQEKDDTFVFNPGEMDESDSECSLAVHAAKHRFQEKRLGLARVLPYMKTYEK